VCLVPLTTCRQLARHSGRAAHHKYTCLNDRQQLLESRTIDYMVFDKIWHEDPSTGGSPNMLPINVLNIISTRAN
jgi:hypothetical protein